jgi:hypothetical protein
MRFAKWVFWGAGVWGILVTLPLYFFEEQLGRDQPPPITHPEYYFGFVGVVLAWQVAFLIIGHDPARYRLMMVPAILEKATYSFAILALYVQQRVSPMILAFGIVDLVLGLLFVIAFLRTREHA